MKNQRSLFGSLAFVTCGLLAAGCMDGAPGEESQVVESTAKDVPVQGEIKFNSNSSGSMQVTGAGWSQAAPGIWQNGNQRLIGGVEGYRSAIKETKNTLASLQARSGEPGVANLVEQNQAFLAKLEGAVSNFKPEPTPAPQVTCNFGFVLGPSSPIDGFIGAFGGVQVVCVDGVVPFLAQAQACTDLGCSPVFTGTANVGPAGWFFGVRASGTLGAACFSQAFLNPPGLVGSANFPCG